MGKLYVLLRVLAAWLVLGTAASAAVHTRSPLDTPAWLSDLTDAWDAQGGSYGQSAYAEVNDACRCIRSTRSHDCFAVDRLQDELLRRASELDLPIPPLTDAPERTTLWWENAVIHQDRASNARSARSVLLQAEELFSSDRWHWLMIEPSPSQLNPRACSIRSSTIQPPPRTALSSGVGTVLNATGPAGGGVGGGSPSSQVNRSTTHSETPTPWKDLLLPGADAPVPAIPEAST